MTTVQEFLRRHEQKKRDGLVDIKFFPLDITPWPIDGSTVTLESFCAESNAIDDAIALTTPLPENF